MEEESTYEIEKQRKKQALVRNEFLYFEQSTSKFEFPIIKKERIDIDKIHFLSYDNTKKDDTENKDKTIHFFTYDWKFEKVYEKADEEIEKLSQYYALLSPDFSMFTNMPMALQIASVFKNRWCGAYWQSHGLKVIPTVSWGDERTFDFCFEGIEKGSVVAVSTYYREINEEEFMLGYNKMLEKIQPSAIICYDELFPSMKGNVKSFLPTTYEWTKNLNPEDKTQFYWEKHNRWISGLNKDNFKFFKYDDPFEKNQVKPCSVCGNAVIIDQFGNGTCEHCGWINSADEENFEKDLKINYPNLVPLSRAREQYKQGLPFKATFEDFVNGLFFYSEMLFEYQKIMYEVFLKPDYSICFCCSIFEQNYKTRNEFMETANINGLLLKDIWKDVTFSGFMYCG